MVVAEKVLDNQLRFNFRYCAGYDETLQLTCRASPIPATFHYVVLIGCDILFGLIMSNNCSVMSEGLDGGSGIH